VHVDRAVDAYLRHVTVERGLSEHTLGAYRRDLAVYAAWLNDQGITDTSGIVSETVSAFIAERAAQDPPPASSSLARLQSSVRGWHRFLVREEIERSDPAARLRPPRMPRRLPKALRIDQVDFGHPGSAVVVPHEMVWRLRERVRVREKHAAARVNHVRVFRDESVVHLVF